MSKDFKVLALAGDVDQGCGFYRIREPARVATEYGIDITVDVHADVTGTIDEDGVMTIEECNIDADLIIFQRPLLRAFYDLMIYVQQQGIACIVEIDDDLKAVHPNNIAYRAMHPKYNKTSNWGNLVKMCYQADLVTTSTQSLADRYAEHGRFAVLRNMIPEVELERPKIVHAAVPRIGWSGTLQTHPEDLDAIGIHMNAILASNGIKDRNFYVVGDGQGVKEKFMLPSDSEVVATGWVPRDDYTTTLNQHMDIGVVPLKIDTFNKGKSALKSMEMASQGIPSVCSPTPENIWLSEYTKNPLADRGKHWQKYVKRLALDPDFLLERSAFVREAVRPLTYENHVEDWVEAWSEAIELRHSQKKFSI